MKYLDLRKNNLFRFVASVGGLALAVSWMIVLSKHESFREREAFASQRGKRKLKKARTINLRLHGSTPSMAWSPDGRRLAFNAAYEYFGFQDEERANRGSLGVFVADMSDGRISRVSTTQGFHPLWLTNTRLAWGNSPYEEGAEGLYTAELKRKGKPKITRIGMFKGVYHTLPAAKGGILMYSGFPEYQRWVTVDPKTGKTVPLSTSGKQRSQSQSWEKPAGMFGEQCLQQAGKISVYVDRNDGRIFLTTKNATLEMEQQSYIFRNYGSPGRCSVQGHCGPVRACLSPKGRYLAYFSATGTRGEYMLHVLPVPN